MQYDNFPNEGLCFFISFMGGENKRRRPFGYLGSINWLPTILSAKVLLDRLVPEI
jgi:hypothetical protein